MAKSQAEAVRELEKTAALYELRFEFAERRIAALEQAEVQNAATRQDHAVTRTRQDDQAKRSEVWGGRGFSVLLVLANMLAGAAGALIVAALRK